MLDYKLRWITVERCATHTELTPDQIYRLIREGKFPWRFVRLGRQIRISALDIGLFEGPQSSNGQSQDETFAQAA